MSHLYKVMLSGLANQEREIVKAVCEEKLAEELLRSWKVKQIKEESSGGGYATASLLRMERHLGKKGVMSKEEIERSYNVSELIDITSPI